MLARTEGTGLATWGNPTVADLATREGLNQYGAAIEWSPERPWRDTRIALPTGVVTTITRFVGENVRRPRMFHPEYALAIELMLANVVAEARARGFRIVAAELGLWAYRTLTTLGRRLTKIGLSEPMLLEDGRTETYDAFQWVDQEGEGVLIVPWANGDQLIRLKDRRGRYIVIADERTADATTLEVQANSWRHVQRYEVLPYENDHPWETIPLLESGEPVVEQRACEGFCHLLFPVEGHKFVRDHRTGKSMCQPCFGELERLRAEAASQGWDYDKRKPLMAPRHIPTVVNPKKRGKCEHKWGVQFEGTMNVGLRGTNSHRQNLKARFECLWCGKSTPEGELSKEHRNLRDEIESGRIAQAARENLH